MATNTKPTKPKAEEWQANCVTKLLPLQGKDFDVVLDDLRFDYGSGLSGRLQLRQGKKAVVSIPELALAPADAFGSMAAEDLDEEIARWSRWLVAQQLVKIAKIEATKLGPFQPLVGKALDEAYADWKEQHDPQPKARVARQRKALDEVTKRFPAFQAHVKKVWGLTVPKSLIAVRAFLDLSRADDDSMATKVLYTSEIREAGIIERLAAGGLARKLEKGKDERCHGRYFRDPPEFLTFLHGGEDGLHFGLWYDDDTSPPAVVLNYARDSGETWFAGDSPMLAIQRRFAEREPAPGRGDFRRRFLLEILAWFVEAEAKLEGRKGKVLRPSVPTPPSILGGRGVRCEGEVSPCDDVSLADDVLGGQHDVLKKWLKEAKSRLAKGDVRMALVLGRSMHWKGGDLCRKTSGPLLEKAYGALGRKALLEITRAHYKDRDAPSVDVFVSEE